MRTVHPPRQAAHNAEQFLKEYEHKLLFRQGDWYRWTGTHWERTEWAGADIGPAALKYFSAATFLDRGEIESFPTTRSAMRDIESACEELSAVGSSVDDWIQRPDGYPADNLLPVTNGLLHWPTGRLYDHTPDRLTFWSLPYGFDPDATCPRWGRFLDETWPDDESQELLQEWFGHFLTGGTELQKLFFLIGPPRSGKGVIERVLHSLLGPDNVGAPSSGSLSENFGLMDLIGKPLAVVSDAQVHRTSDVLLERLLTISGEGRVQIDRKYKTPWVGRLPTRFLIVSNKPPAFREVSGALRRRVSLLQTRRSWSDVELDPKLDAKLTAELPGILNWALAGAERLRGELFTEPEASAGLLQDWADQASPVTQFLRDECELGDYSVPVDRLWLEWLDWCSLEGKDFTGTKQHLGTDLRAAANIEKKWRGPRDGREYHYVGVRLQKGRRSETDSVELTFRSPSDAVRRGGGGCEPPVCPQRAPPCAP